MQNDVTGLLIEFGNGSKKAYNELFTAVYNQLKIFATKQLKYENQNHTYSRTDVVFLDMVDKNEVDWKNRAHFLWGGSNLCESVVD